MVYSTKVRNIDWPWLRVVTDADPDFQRGKHNELEYDFAVPGRKFYADPYKRGAYGPQFIKAEPVTDGYVLSEPDGGRIILE